VRRGADAGFRQGGGFNRYNRHGLQAVARYGEPRHQIGRGVVDETEVSDKEVAPYGYVNEDL
jgi:hypothetical protein